MTDGLIAELDELIALKGQAQRLAYKPQKTALQTGFHRSILKGRGMDFAELRHYQAGDELRHMDWRVTARTGRPHIKLYQEERERPVWLVADFNPSMYFGTRGAFKSVIAARLAALLAWTVVKQGDKIGALLSSPTHQQEFSPSTRSKTLLPLLAALSAYTKISFDGDESKKLNDILIRAQQVLRSGSLIILISDFYHYDEASIQHLSRLRVHNEILAYHICDILELASPKPQQYAISNGITDFIWDMRNEVNRQHYQDYCEQRIENLKSVFKKLQIQYNQVTANVELSALIGQTLLRRVYG